MRSISPERDAVLLQNLAGNRPGYAARNRLAGRGAPPAARVAYAVFRLIREVGVRRTEDAEHIVVVGGVLVGVPDHETDGRARRLSLVDAGEELDLVALLARRSQPRLAGPPTVQFLLDALEIELDTSRTAVDDASDGRTVGLTEAGEPEDVSESIHVML